ncbi:MAG: hypothetical protein QME58_09290 [Bacteroidota bacterium]|nr:hypothetical protein [Bacteroidota bacterium]
MIQTIGNYEGMTGVGNGLVEIDLVSMKAISKIPPGTETIWDKDGGETVAFYYDKPIEETSIDQRFKLKEVEQYKSEDSIVIASLGYERYMVEQAKYESELR